MARNKRYGHGGWPSVGRSPRRWVLAAGAVATAVLTALAGLVATPGTAGAVAGGSVAAEGAYPFVAMVDAGTFGACSGVLVHPEWVVTVKSCLPDFSVPVMPPPTATTVTIGGARIAAEEVSPHPTLPVILLKLASPVTGVAPVALGAAPIAAETLRVAGYGRTAQVWVPDRVHAATVTVGQVTDGGFTIAAAEVTTCQGDAGGAALREANSQTNARRPSHRDAAPGPARSASVASRGCG